VERAEALAWEHGLRGYDAVQLASALTWKESVGEEIVVATFDQQLWDAAKRSGLHVWPEELPRGTGEPERRQDEQDDG
jgi:predicted nucleic acid-binding protein